MTVKEAISILEKELNCQEAEEKYCKQWLACSSCPYDFDEDDLPVAIKVIIGLLDVMHKVLLISKSKHLQ